MKHRHVQNIAGAGWRVGLRVAAILGATAVGTAVGMLGFLWLLGEVWP